MNKLTCSACGQLFPADSEFCPFCGEKKNETCRQCGNLRFDGGDFCPYCGTSYSGAVTPQIAVHQKEEQGASPKKGKKVVATWIIVAAIVLGLLNVGQLVVLMSQNTAIHDLEVELEETERELKEAELERKDWQTKAAKYRGELEHYQGYAVFASDGYYYHEDYDCSHFTGDYYIFNTAYAEWKGYKACPYCCK